MDSVDVVVGKDCEVGIYFRSYSWTFYFINYDINIDLIINVLIERIKNVKRMNLFFFYL